MAQKCELIRELYEQTLGQITATQSAWQSFLRSACHNYKCRFDEQVLIYAQRPDATAVLEIERWNQQFGRWVNAGATGIAVFDRQANKRPGLKHYFDISDTHESRSTRSVPVWEMQPEYHAEIVEALEASFGTLKDSSALDVAVLSAVTNAVEDNHQAYLQQLLGVTADSFLEGMDEDAVVHFFKEALGGAAAYMLLVRCGENADDILSPISFSPAMQFNTPETITLLGTAASDVAETMLREIARTVLSIQTRKKNVIHTLAKEKQTEYAVPISKETPQTERSFEHGNHIQNARRLSPAQSVTATNGGGGHRQIWTDAQEIFRGKPQGNVRDSADERNAVRAFSGNQYNSQGTNGAIDTRDDAGAGRDGTAQGDRPNALGGTGQQHQERSGGNRAAGVDLQLTLQEPEPEPQALQSEKADSNALPAFLEQTKIINTDIQPLRTPQAQVSFFDENYPIYTGDTQQLTLFKGFSITPEITDTVLRLGSTDPKSKRRICAYFAKDKPLVENIRFLKQAYKTGGEGVVLEGHKVSVWYDDTGISIAKGESAQRVGHTLVSWEAAAKRIKELLAQGQYLSQVEIDDAPCLERGEIADMLIYTWRDIELHADEAPLLTTVAEVYKNTSGFPDTSNGVAALLQQPDTVAQLIDEYKAYMAAYEANPDIVRFRFYRPQQKYLQRLLDLQLTPLTFTSSQIFPPPIARFITRDEIDAAITGSYERASDDRLATYSYFVNNRTPQVRATYLRKRQIYSSYSWGPNGHLLKESKGFRISRGSYTGADATVQLTWSKVQQRIADLMAQDKYLCDADHAAMPQYEKHEIARQLFAPFSNYMYGAQNPDLFDYDFHKVIRYIEQQLDDPEKTQALQQKLLPIYESTAPDDRYYEMRKKGIAMLTSYANGTFSLFGKHGEPTALTAIEQAPITAEDAAQQAQQLTVRIGELYEELGVSLKKRRTPAELLQDLNAPKSLETLMDTLSDAAARLGDDADTTELDALLEDLQAFSELEVPAPSQNNGTPAPSDIAQTITAQLAKVSDAAGYPTFSADVQALLREKNGDGLIPIIALNWLKKLASFSDEALREYVQAYEAGTLDALREANDLHAEDAQTEPKKAISTPTRAKVRERIAFTPLHPEIPAEQRHNFRITDAQLGVGTPTEKYNANVTAIRLLQTIEAENRLATPDEQTVLSQYVGWGGLASCFEETHAHYAELKALLSPNEYAAARESTLTAFYTPPIVIEAMYKALEQMGFTTGNVLDPACGVGNFFGMLPESMHGAKLYGVELDSLSGRIAKQLYQNGSVIVNGYEKTEMPDNFFDLAVGNVPFGDFKVLERRYDKHNWLIHDFFFGKTLDKVRPGGVVAFVTSKGTLDKKNGAVRKYLAQRADLIGAIRLPNSTFKKNAGTEVTSDIIFLQKRDRMIEHEPDWVHLDTDRYDVTMNHYFVQHPEMVLGTMEMVSGPFGMESTCKPYEGADLSQLLSEALQNLHAEIAAPTLEDLADEDEDLSLPADPCVRNFSYTVATEKLYYRENSSMVPVSTTETGEARIRGMITLRDCARRLIALQTENYPDVEITEAQSELNYLYDSYTKKYGVLTSRGNEMAFSEDSSYPLLCSLEELNDKGEFVRKAAMFTKRTIKPHVPVTSVDTSVEALAVSISEKARVDMEYMAQLSGKDTAELENDLSGVIFRDVKCATEAEDVPTALVEKERFALVPADEYLSGNVREKLAMAKALYEVLPDVEKQWLAPNITALEAVQPIELTAGEISVRLGATWIPPAIYKQFMHELLGTGENGKKKIEVLYTRHTGEWHITNKTADYGNVKVFSTYGTLRASAYHILEQSLNLKDVRIFDTKTIDGKDVRILNAKETQVAQDRQEAIKGAFSEWLWKDIDRREAMCKLYNETFNSIRPREYDGRHISFVGMNPEYTLEPHQINAVARGLYGGNTLLAHCVGAGKTFEMVAIAMESKRLGLCAKSLFTVPNHIIGQFAAEWLQLYPSANLLVATKKDFEAKNRKKFCARISTGDYDAVIIGHSQSERIPMSPERQERMITGQMQELSFSITEAKNADCPRYTIKQLEKSRKTLQTKLESLNDQTRKDDVVCFEELGVDRLFVDESHNFKNLFLTTKMRNVGGIAQTDAKKSSDLYMKCRYLDEITDSKGIVFATGTPISNSMVELFTIQRYLQYERLSEMGLLQFDAWASTFGETVTAMELAPEGTGFRIKTRFSKFYNLPELIAVFKEVADIQTADMLNLPVPKTNFHVEALDPSELQKQMVAACADRAEDVRSGSVDPRIDNMLKITNDGRKIALDIRLFNPLAPEDENGKVSVCAKNVHRIWQDSTERRGAQLVFCDLSTPHQNRPIEMQETDNGTYEMIPDQFTDVYNALKHKLVEKGIPEHEISFIHEANTDARKQALFSQVRAGEVRVLIGSTFKMGAGTNVQKKLVAMHDLDCPWRPSDLEQRLGRIVRQKNENPEVDIYRYVTKGTFDAYMYQLVETKQRFIAQIFTSKTPVRIAEDVDGSALSYAEIKALATGNPMIIEKCNLDVEVSRLNTLKSHYLNQKYNLEAMVLRKYPETIAQLVERTHGYEADCALLAQHPKVPEVFSPMELFGTRHIEKETAGKALLNACAKLTSPEAVAIGSYRGFALLLGYAADKNEFRVIVKGALSHTVTLGADLFGNLTRIENAMEAIPERRENVMRELTETKVQLENARTEMEKPFAKEDELQQKMARLNEVTSLLKLDEKDRSVVDTEPDESEPEAPRRSGQER